MFFPILAGILGLMLGGKSRPISRQLKMKMLGPVTGNHYQVEDLIDAGSVVVLAPDGTVVVFDRAVPGGPLSFKQARGNAGTVDLVKKDFLPPEEKARVGERAADAGTS